MTGRGSMSVRDAGGKGGRKTADTHDSEHFQRIGKMGGDRVSKLVKLGKKAEEQA